MFFDMYSFILSQNWQNQCQDCMLSFTIHTHLALGSFCYLFGFIFHKSIGSGWCFILNFPPIQENSFHPIFPSEGSQNMFSFLKLR